MAREAGVCDYDLREPERNHGEAWLLSIIEQLPLIAKIDTTYLYGGVGDLEPFIEFAREHAGHRVVPRSEYGYDYDQCRERQSCPACRHQHEICSLKDKHGDDHVFSWTPRDGSPRDYLDNYETRVAARRSDDGTQEHAVVKALRAEVESLQRLVSELRGT